ncbi:MAG: hypothetical protein HY695_12450 [Deltaproteobacteria bacterium]|nr:hypothetical protein [Deltaproteobacteria bacterium]
MINANVEMKSENFKIFPFALCALHFAFLLSGCASFQAAGAVQAGRQDLIIGRPDSALAHFQRAAEMDPNYVANFTPLQQGVWTYVGRAQYDLGKLPDARQALERSRSRNESDALAKLYLGLTVLRQEKESQKGLTELSSGMRELSEWLDYISQNTWYGRFWDPGRKIRSELQTNLAMISRKEIDWQKLIAGGEWVGKKLEEEVDLARRDEVKEMTMEGEGGDGEP